MKQKLLLIFLTTSISCFSQSKNSVFYGKIVDSAKTIKNVHIVNFQSKQGTFSNDNGLFSISAKKNDSLQITAIGYKSRIIVLKAFHFRENKNIIVLKEEVYNLEEVLVKKHNLTGILSLDIKKVQRNYKETALESLMEGLLNLDFYKISKMGFSRDEMHLTKASKVHLPNYRFEGFGITTGSSGPSKATLTSKKLEEEKKIPDKILSEFGTYFFFTELKIPKEKYYHFITYCTFKNIFELYKKKETFQLIQILKTESKTYLEILKNK